MGLFTIETLSKRFIDEICRIHQIPLTYLTQDRDKPYYYVLSFGTGIMMAYLDGFAPNMKDYNIGAIDLGGKCPIDHRVAVIDYATTHFPCSIILWSSLRSANIYLDKLKERGNLPRNCLLYLRGLGEENIDEWIELGYNPIDNIGSSKPLKSFME